MALIEVKVPQLSESVAEATLLQWHKSTGESVARDENLIDIETDKVVLELPAQQAGVLSSILKPSGSTVVAGEVIAIIDTEATQGVTTSTVLKNSQSASDVMTPSPKPAVAMPAAAKMMQEKGVSGVSGTGKDGRITKADVLSALEKNTTSLPESKLPLVSASLETNSLIDSSDNVDGRSEQRVPMSRLRQRVAERLVQSQRTNAILTTFNEVIMQPVMDLRKRHQERFEKEHGVRLGFMSFFVKACVHALKKYPIVNASVDETNIVYHGYFDIGVAVGSPRGLVVPVIRDADRLSFSQLELKIADFGKRAQEGKLGLEELTGGTFSISNGGVFGSMLSTPIINPPQSAILGIHATKDRAVVENGQVVVRPVNYFALSYDHRIIDGRDAVLFLVAVKEALEDPSRMLLDL